MRIAVFDKVTPGYETALSMWSMDGSYFKNKRNSAAGHRGHETHRATEDLACSQALYMPDKGLRAGYRGSSLLSSPHPKI